MHAIEFTTELNDSRVLPIPEEAALRLPKTGKVHVILIPDEIAADAEWQAGAYEQFLRDDSPEDEIYEALR